jgi:protein-S-isoprenylcysteine O-methyltransferase Ste14
VLIRDRLLEQGAWLFRLRSSLPVLLAPLALLALRDSQWIETRYGDAIDDAFDWLCLGVSAVGLALRTLAAGSAPRRTSGRNTRKGQVADELNTTGLYSIVRHPLYLANFAIFSGFLLATCSPWFALVGVLAYWIYYERIAYAEEEFLLRRFGTRYLIWVQNTPAFVPRPSAWRAAELAFCWRTALKREYRTVCATLLGFALLDYAEDAVALGRFEYEDEATLMIACAALAFTTIRVLHKHSRLLHVEGR